MSTTIKIRRDTALNWATANPTPASGEFCIVTDATPQRLKIGDGVTQFNTLPYFSLPEVSGLLAGLMSVADKTKLDGIAAGAIDSATAATVASATALTMLYRPVAECIRATFVAPSDNTYQVANDETEMRLMIVDGVSMLPSTQVELTAGTHTVEYIIAGADIPKSTFKDCAEMTEVYLPSWVRNIADYAFEGCAALEKVYCESMTPPTLGTDAFGGIDGAAVAVVHSVVLTEYQGDADWTTAFSTITNY